jgi:hypothetical protein
MFYKMFALKAEGFFCASNECLFVLLTFAVTDQHAFLLSSYETCKNQHREAILVLRV